MSSERWHAIEEAFQRVMDAPVASRARLLDELDDDELRREVQSLITASGEDEFLLPGVPARIDASARPQTQQAGRLIGHYRIVRLLDEGGMGSVYLAGRADGEFEQHVAIKLLRTKPSADALDRFLRERDILARLDHPAIARLIDAGTTDDGLPYLAMEYVDGAPIDAFCREHALDLRQRCELMIAVCDAIARAHQSLVIHRDLKPANILVSGSQSPPQPRIIDFGIAFPAFLGDDATQHSTSVLGTLAYMSPEQCNRSRQPLDVRSDVYSLGVILYELLTGARPHDFSTRSLGEAIRAITDAPASPASRFNPKARGDLDTILAKALEKDPVRRYQTASAFADDLRRFLHDKPIHARPPNVLYAIRKLAKRRRGVILAASGAMVLAILIGAVSLLWFHYLPRWSNQALLEARMQVLSPRTQSILYASAFFNYVPEDDPDSTRPRTGPEDLQRFATALKSYDRASALAFLDDLATRERGVVLAVPDLVDVPIARWPEVNPPATLTPEAWKVASARDRPAATQDATPEALRDAALLLLLARHPGPAIEVLRRYESLVLTDPLLEGLMGELYLALGHPELAYPRLRAAYDAFENSRMMTIALAEAAIGVNDLARAEALLAQVAKLPNPDPYDRLTRVRALYYAKLGDDEKALDHFNAACGVFPPDHPMHKLEQATGNPVARAQRAGWHESRGELNKALEHYARAMFVQWLLRGEGHRVPMRPLAGYVRVLEQEVGSWTEQQRELAIHSLGSAESLLLQSEDDPEAPPLAFTLQTQLLAYALARRELCLRPARVALSPDEAAAFAIERAGWSQPTDASELSELLRVADDELWAKIEQLGFEGPVLPLLEAWRQGDAESANRLATQLKSVPSDG